MRFDRLSVIALALLLGACTTTPRTTSQQPQASPSVTEKARQQQSIRENRLASYPQWSLKGRVSFVNDRQSGNGHLDWQQNDQAYSISISAPITRQSVNIIGSGNLARIEGLKGGTKEGVSGEQLLQEALGWQLPPVQSLAAWIRALPEEGQSFTNNAIFSTRDHLLEFDSRGWRVRYLDWVMINPQAEGAIEMPRLIEASQGNTRVRIVIEEWNMQAK